MGEKFLLSCECGQKQAVEKRQAGTTLTCVCGKQLEVPTIRRLGELPRVEEGPEDLPPIWSLRHGLVFLGLVIALPAFAFSAYLYSQIPTLQETNIQESINQLSPAESWMLWRHYDDGLPKMATPETKAIVDGIHRLQRWITVGVIVGCIGLVISSIAFFVKPNQASDHESRLHQTTGTA